MQLPARIETARLSLRKPRLDDAASVYRNYAADPEVTRFLTWTPHECVEESAEVLATRLAHWELGSDFSWSLVPRDGSALLIGMISTAPDETDGTSWSIGCVLGRPWWNRGFMTEALGAILETLSAEPQITRIWAYAHEANGRSIRMLEKAGMTRDTAARHSSVCPTSSPEPRPAAVFFHAPRRRSIDRKG